MIELALCSSIALDCQSHANTVPIFIFRLDVRRLEAKGYRCNLVRFHAAGLVLTDGAVVGDDDELPPCPA